MECIFRPYRRFQDQTEEEKESLSNLINKGGHIPPGDFLGCY